VTASAAARIGTPIRSPAGHAWSFDDTERRLAPLLDRVPITRVYDATAVDRLGLPVWGAVTPLARDLTVHGGKGATPQAARISAVMEAIERVSAEDVDPLRVRRATFAQLQAEDPAGVADPDAFDLDFDTRYAPDLPFSWVSGEDLLSGERVWVALDLAVSPAREGLCWGTASNGLAAGNTGLEAVLHALYEVIERDADALRRFLNDYGEGSERVPMRLLLNESLPALASAWVRSLEEAGLFVGVEEITHDLGVPAFRAVLSDPAFPGREPGAAAFEGFGCDLDAANAVMRALTEAVQAHTVVLLGARDRYEGLEPQRQTRTGLLGALSAPAQRTEFAATAPPADLEGRLAVVLERLQAAGLPRCIVVELTRADLGVPVVRVLIPGACGPGDFTARRPALRLLRHLV
jgi:ribosomal protein S12 methylthiotransferase accessory factor